MVTPLKAAHVIATLCLCFLVSSRAMSQLQPASIADRAMQDELARTFKELSSGSLPPYFIAYRTVETQSVLVAATFGSLLSAKQDRARVLSVEVRVGDYRFDNTNFVSSEPANIRNLMPVRPLPLDDDYEQLRRCIREATQEAYEQAVEEFEMKRAVLAAERPSVEISDFSREDPVVAEDLPRRVEAEPVAMEQTARQFSALFRTVPNILASRVELLAANVDTRYVNTEGTRVHKVQPWVRFTAAAMVQSENRERLSDCVQAFGKRWSDLPPTGELDARIRSMIARLQSAELANGLDSYQGPILFTGQAAPQLLEQAFVPSIIGTRLPLVDDGMRHRNPQQRETETLRIGSRVLPTFLSLTEDPTLDSYAGIPLPVTYRIDDDGVRARRKVVVQSGVLTTLLTSRTPASGVEHSTGNRWGGAPMAANVIVIVKNGLSAGEMKAKLLQLVALHHLQYGIVVRRMAKPFLSGGPPEWAESLNGYLSCTGVYKVFPDGSEQQVRSLQLGEFGPRRFRDIVAASRQVTLNSERIRSDHLQRWRMGDPGVVSVASPDLILDDLTLIRSSHDVQTPPVIGSPLLAVDEQR